MSNTIPESDLPTTLSPQQAFEAAYPDELSRATEALLRGLPTLIECDKGVAQNCFVALRTRLRNPSANAQCVLIDGRGNPQPGMPSPGLAATMLEQIRTQVRSGTDDGAGKRKVLVLLHLDLLVTSGGGVTSEAKEAIALLYENPNILWLGFRDSSFSLPKSIKNLFHLQISIGGIPRDRLGHLVTQGEAQKLGQGGLDVYRLYKHVSGLNAVRLRSLMASLVGEAYPHHSDPVWRQIRQATVEDGMSIPEVSLVNDIGGYSEVKKKITEDILDTIKHKESLSDPKEIARIESLIPRGMLFHGPPGTGKTFFAKAIASALGAAIQIVNGPELKSRWVGESEENLRKIFTQARQSAPAIIVFDELDSFAAARGSYTGSGVEHSMVNQLLTEMDGFNANEMVFVIGTTNFVESIDEALLRPGRFEFKIHIPYPNADDREAILKIFDEKFGLSFDKEALGFAVRQTGQPVEGSDPSGRWSGDHIKALCRSLARKRLRASQRGPTTILDVEAVLTADADLPALTPAEELVIATHECGHALVALHTKNSPKIERISIRGDVAGSLGSVRFADPHHKYVTTHDQLLDSIAVLFGGREAERIILGKLSVGSSHDLETATGIARSLIEKCGYRTEDSDVVMSSDKHMSDITRRGIDQRIEAVLDEQRKRAASIIEEHRIELLALCDKLQKDKTIEVTRL